MAYHKCMSCYKKHNDVADILTNIQTGKSVCTSCISNPTLWSYMCEDKMKYGPYSEEFDKRIHYFNYIQLLENKLASARNALKDAYMHTPSEGNNPLDNILSYYYIFKADVDPVSIKCFKNESLTKVDMNWCETIIRRENQFTVYNIYSSDFLTWLGITDFNKSDYDNQSVFIEHLLIRDKLNKRFFCVEIAMYDREMKTTFYTDVTEVLKQKVDKIY